MTNYSKHILRTPQSSPVPGQDMEKNNAGGYSFPVSPQVLLERFLTIGSEGGTYYVSEAKLTVDNASKIIKLIKEDGFSVLNTVIDFAQERRAPKADPGLFVLALLVTYGDPEVKSASYDVIQHVATTSTQLFTFLTNVTALRGWSRGLRRGISEFYTSKTAEKVAYQFVKYRQRNGWTHRDVLRLCHASAKSTEMNKLFKYAVGKLSPEETGNSLITAFQLAMETTSNTRLAYLIREYNLTWEMVPTDKLNNVEVLSALVEKMPPHALLRNLNRITISGLLEDKPIRTLVVSKIGEASQKTHPVVMLNTLRVYAKGHGDLGGKTWVPNQKIVDALNDGYYESIKSIVPTGKDILVAVDVSSSMSSGNVAKMQLTPKEAAAALSTTFMKSEPNADCMWFDTKITEVTFGARTSLDEVLRVTPNGGGTDCSLPFNHMNAKKKKYDAVIILTDSETWAGNSHAVQELAIYRNKINRDVKVIEIGMVANNYSNFPADDKNVLQVAGFDSTVPEVVNQFIG